MDAQIIGAFIGGGATIVAAIIGLLKLRRKQRNEGSQDIHSRMRTSKITAGRDAVVSGRDTIIVSPPGGNERFLSESAREVVSQASLTVIPDLEERASWTTFDIRILTACVSQTLRGWAIDGAKADAFRIAENFRHFVLGGKVYATACLIMGDDSSTDTQRLNALAQWYAGYALNMRADTTLFTKTSEEDEQNNAKASATASASSALPGQMREISIEDADLVSCNITTLERYFSPLFLSAKSAKELRGSIVFTSTWCDGDKRPNYAIPQWCAYMQAVFAALPHFSYFLLSIENTYVGVVLSLLPEGTVEDTEGGVRYDHAVLVAKLVSLLRALTRYCGQIGDDSAPIVEQRLRGFPEDVVRDVRNRMRVPTVRDSALGEAHEA